MQQNWPTNQFLGEIVFSVLLMWLYFSATVPILCKLEENYSIACFTSYDIYGDEMGKKIFPI